jgi:hypothetical protein
MLFSEQTVHSVHLHLASNNDVEGREISKEDECTLKYFIFEICLFQKSRFLLRYSFIIIELDAINLVRDMSREELIHSSYFLEVHHCRNKFYYRQNQVAKQFERIQKWFESNPALLAQLYNIDFVSLVEAQCHDIHDIGDLLLQGDRIITTEVINFFSELQQALSGDYVLK